MDENIGFKSNFGVWTPAKFPKSLIQTGKIDHETSTILLKYHQDPIMTYKIQQDP